MTDQMMTTSLDALLEFIRDTRGFDFTGYKRSSIERRVTKRMAEVEIPEGRYDEYVDYLELHADEFAELFNTLLINVTAFFRDPPIWEHLATRILPALLASRPETSPVRIWCAGCASGEEPLTVAMVLANALGEEAFRDRVKIYATDLDEHALDQARHGVYLPRQVEDVPRDVLERYFERTDQRYIFRKDLRRNVIFGRNDLVQDAPISRIDLLVCRNTLMYFTAETQSQILRRFHFALNDDGVLLLGKSEMLISHSELFAPVDLKWRVFNKVVRPAMRDRVRLLALDHDGNPSAPDGISADLREVAFDVTGPANLIVDAEGMAVMANDAARRMFGLNIADFGRPVQDLELSYRPLELRAHLDTVASTGRAVEINAVPWRHGDKERLLDVRLFPLVGSDGSLGTSVSYADVTESSRLQQQLARSREELEHAYEELQATVEELETMNEELQSTNEELETMNEELRHRTLELNDINSFLETILTTIGLAVVVLDRRQHVQIWNHQARELWGLASEEVEDQHLLSLDIGLPVEQLKGLVRVCLAGSQEPQEIVIPAVTRRGKSIQCKVTCLPLGTRLDGEVTGVIMMMEPVDETGARA